MKDELGGKIMIEFDSLKLKTYSYLTDDLSNIKKAKRTKKWVIERYLKLNIIKTAYLRMKSYKITTKI